MGKSDPYIALGPGGEYDYQKIRVDGNGAVIISGVVSGSFTVTSSGLAGGLKTKAVIVGDTPTLLKTDLATRDTVSIRVWGVETVYVGDSTVTAAQGYPKLQYEEIISDIQSVTATELYGICEAGKSCEVRIWEIDA